MFLTTRRPSIALLSVATFFAGGAVGCTGGPSAADLAPQRQSLSAAQPRIAADLERKRPTAVSFVTVPVVETTPDGLWEAMAVQTFNVTGDMHQYESFAVTEGDVEQLGSGFGGPGIIEYQLVDADRDGTRELAFVVGSGTGVKRYTVGLLDRPQYEPVDPANPPATKPAPAPMRQRAVRVSYRDPLTLKETAAGVEVWDPARQTRIGRITGGGGAVRFEPEANLPRIVRQRVLEPRM